MQSDLKNNLSFMFFVPKCHKTFLKVSSLGIGLTHSVWHHTATGMNQVSISFMERCPQIKRCSTFYLSPRHGMLFINDYGVN